MEKTIRSSNFELLRLILMIFIMLHHFIYAMPRQLVTPGLHIADTFFHTAVIVFILLSGYFGIKFKLSSLFKLFLQVIFYSLILTIFAKILFNNISWLEIIKSLMPFTNGYYWFISIYLQLFLLSPFVNLVLAEINNKQYMYLLLILSFLVFYVGLLRGDNICVDGKNITNFIFIYCVGHGLHRISSFVDNKKKQFKIYSASIVFFILLFLLLGGYFCSESIWRYLIKLTYYYNSPGLLIISICLFIFFKTFDFKSIFVNRLALSSLAIYLFHEHPHMRDILYKNFFSEISLNCQMWYLVLLLFAFAIMLGISAILVDIIRLRIFDHINPKLKKLDSFFKID